MKELSPKNKKCDVLDKRYLEKFQEHMMHSPFHISNFVDVPLTSISIRFLRGIWDKSFKNWIRCQFVRSVTIARIILNF